MKHPIINVITQSRIVQNKKIFYPLLGVVLLLILWIALRGGEEQPEIVATATLEKGTVKKVLEATGIVKPQVGAIVEIGAQATGLIKEMRVKVGDEVKKDELIARIDDRELVSQRKETQALLEKQKISLERIKKTYPLRIKESKAEFEQAKAQLNFAKKRIARQEELLVEELISQDEFDTLQEEFEVAENNYIAREAAFKRTQTEFIKDRREAEKQLVETRARLESIGVRLSHTTIKSPIDGFVSQVAAQEGETVVAGLEVANLITVIDPTRLEMWIYVDETDVGQVRPGHEVEYRVDAFQDMTFKERVSTIYPQPEIRDNIVYYRALVPISKEQAMKLRPEMTTHCQILVNKKEDVLAIPNEALKWVDGSQVVFLQKDSGDIQEVTPELGLSGLNFTEVLSGLSPGDTVATQVVLPERE